MYEIIKNINHVLLLLINSGIVTRVVSIIIKYQMDENINIKDLLIKYIKVLAIANTAMGLVEIIANYYR